MISAILWGGLAAASLLVGFYLSSRDLSNRSIGMVMGFGGGALLSAIAYELIPQSVAGGWLMGVTFIAGALTFFGVDWLIDHQGGADRKDIEGTQVGSGSAIFI
jgi:ZIP family zinc transporter